VKQVKHDESWIFSTNTHRALSGEGKLTGLTADSAVLFMKEYLLFTEKSFFLEFENEDRAFGFYNSCIENDDRCFLFFPSKKNTGGIPGFDMENTRFRKEAVVRLGSGPGYCCIGSRNSLEEMSLSKNMQQNLQKNTFRQGDLVDVGLVSEGLLSVGYERVNMVFEPGSYSLRGDVLDVFPQHFKNPFRLSFEFDTIENISIYDPNTQLSIKKVKTLRLEEYNNSAQTIDNINITDHFSPLKKVGVAVLGEQMVLYGDFNSKPTNLSFRVIENPGTTPKEKVEKTQTLGRDLKHRVLVGKRDSGVEDMFSNVFFTSFVHGAINNSLISNKLSTLIVSENDICSIRPSIKKWSPSAKEDGVVFDRASISKTRVGDFVVHKNFGVGVYRGIKTKNNKENIEIEYNNNTVVYVSLDQVSLVHRYIGSGQRPRISSLGSKRWASEVKKTKNAAQQVALDVLKGYSNKKQKRPFSYSLENDLDNVLSGSFSFIETPDQKTTINKVFYEMNGDVPMDRLVCGDVGFGKTEVGIRAMFKSFLSDRLSVFLCPTTILADQHYITCNERLGVLGVKIRLLSRFKSQKEQKKTLKELKAGKVDVLVGTHRILSGDVGLPNLGLLIIDEEHRFGVKHKETIRNLRAGVDVLTLTATPIPRTLQQSLVGLKDISIMGSPPETRRPILTFVKYFDWSLVFSRIDFELSRSGQVYFLNNDTISIPSVVDKLRTRFPGRTIAGASGKMKSKVLEKTILAFFKGKIDVLVCTTIIESGLDVTNANSIIIKDAQNLGLSQLYQIRGRVGRGDRQAYCHLLIPRKNLEEDAFKRLRSLEQNTALGSGYNISMQDLEIRGSGAIFGHKQSGHISAVGFQMYCDLLSIEIQKKTSPEKAACFQPQMKTNIHASIEKDYVENMSMRVDYYYRIGRATKMEELTVIEKSLIDVFGPIPKPTKNLLSMASVRILYTETPVVEIDCRDTLISLLIGEIDKEKQMGFLSSVGNFVDSGLARVQFKDEDKNALRVFLYLVDGSSPFVLLLSFVHLFASSNKN